MLTIKSRSWDEIEKHYSALEMKPMVELVQQIINSNYISGIYATTSLFTLCISQNAEFEFDKNMLRVDFSNDKFIFRYKEFPYSKNEWKKECDKNKGFSTFEHVMNRLKWFMS